MFSLLIRFQKQLKDDKNTWIREDIIWSQFLGIMNFLAITDLNGTINAMKEKDNQELIKSTFKYRRLYKSVGQFSKLISYSGGTIIIAYWII